MSLLHPRFLLAAGGSAFSMRLQVGEDQLGVDRLDVVGRVDLAVDVDDVRVVEGADHLADRVGLADVGQELVAQPLPLGGAADDAGDVDEADTVAGTTLRRLEQLGELVQPRVGHADHADVGLDRRERVVRRQHVVLGQRVEQGRLADVRQSDDSDGQAHVVQSTDPPSTSNQPTGTCICSVDPLFGTDHVQLRRAPAAATRRRGSRRRRAARRHAGHR